MWMLENQSIKQIAPMRYRFIALAIDYLVFVIYGVFLFGLSFLFRPLFSELFTSSAEVAQLTGFVFITLPVIMYFVLGESSKGMGSIGKRKLGLAVTDHKGERIRIFRSLIRNLIKFTPWELAHFAIWRLRFPTSFSESFLLGILIMVNVIVLIFIFCPFLNRNRKSLYDWLAGTKVIIISPKQRNGRGKL
jgi:uncharacterized RDD family membrane protein YckC